MAKEWNKRRMHNRSDVLGWKERREDSVEGEDSC